MLTFVRCTRMVSPSVVERIGGSGVQTLMVDAWALVPRPTRIRDESDVALSPCSTVREVAMDNCSCGGRLKVVSVDLAHAFDISQVVGLQKVTISGAIRVCVDCGRPAFEGELIETVLDSIARSMLRSNFPIRGPEVRFLRKFMQLTQAELALRMAVDRVTVARWEGSSSAIPGPEAIALR